MTDEPGWQDAFLAASTLLGEPRDAAVAALGEAPGDVAEGSETARALRSASREVRARAVARVATALVLELERAGLR